MSAAPNPVRFSHLKAYGRSAAHGKVARDPNHVRKQTPAMELGSAVDGLIYGTRKLACYEGATRAGKKFTEFRDENAGALILLKDVYDKAHRMAESIRSAPWATPWLEGIHQETMLFPWNGLDCRSTPDTRGRGFLTELKCTTNASPDFWQFHHRRMAYNVQMWMQGIGCELLGHRIEKFVIIACEMELPHVVTAFELTERSLEKGAGTLMFWAEKLKVAESSQVWTPYSTTLVPLDIPDDVELVYPDDEDEDDATPARDVTMAG